MKSYNWYFYGQKNWKKLIENLPYTQRMIFLFLGEGQNTAIAIANNTYQKKNSISAEVARLYKAEILTKVKTGIYQITDREFAAYCQSLGYKSYVQVTEKEIKQEIYRRAYRFGESLFATTEKELSSSEKAQKLADYAVNLLTEAPVGGN